MWATYFKNSKETFDVFCSVSSQIGAISECAHTDIFRSRTIVQKRIFIILLHGKEIFGSPSYSAATFYDVTKIALYSRGTIVSFLMDCNLVMECNQGYEMNYFSKILSCLTSKISQDP